MRGRDVKTTAPSNDVVLVSISPTTKQRHLFRQRHIGMSAHCPVCPKTDVAERFMSPRPRAGAKVSCGRRKAAIRFSPELALGFADRGRGRLLKSGRARA